MLSSLRRRRKPNEPLELMKSPMHYGRRAGAEFCDDINCDHCRIGKRQRKAEKPMPGALADAGRWLRDAQKAWALAETAADDVSLRQFASETETALRMAQALLDEWFTFGDITPGDDDGGPF